MLLWVSDIHLDFVKRGKLSQAEVFGEYLSKENPEATGIVITGDISNGSLIDAHMKLFAEGFKKPVYFVLGNHDYYGKSFSEVDEMVVELVQNTPNIHWLNRSWHVLEDSVLVGVGGWYDLRYGNPNSPVELQDFYEISNFKFISKHRPFLVEEIRNKAKSEADVLEKMLTEACGSGKSHVVVATHVPPYGKASWHMGEISGKDYLPYFSSFNTGQVLDKIAYANPDKMFTVLCGHNHSPGIYKHADNLVVYTAKADYGVPDLAGILDLKNKSISAFDHDRKNIVSDFKIQTDSEA